MPETSEVTVVWSGRGPLPGCADDDPAWSQRELPKFGKKGYGEFPSEEETRRSRSHLVTFNPFVPKHTATR